MKAEGKDDNRPFQVGSFVMGTFQSFALVNLGKNVNN